MLLVNFQNLKHALGIKGENYITARELLKATGIALGKRRPSEVTT